MCLNVSLLSCNHLWLLLNCSLRGNKKASEGKSDRAEFLCVWDFVYLVLYRALRNLVRERAWHSTLPGAPCPGKYLGCRRRLLVCVSNQSYSALNDRVEPPGIFHSSLGLAGLKPVILLPANSCC